MGLLSAEEAGAHGSRHCLDVLEATDFVDGLRAVIYVSGVGRRALAVVPELDRTSIRLAGLTARYAMAEAAAHSIRTPRAVRAPSAGIWNCPIRLTGPEAPVEHSPLDRVDLLDTELIVGAVRVLERIAASF